MAMNKTVMLVLVLIVGYVVGARYPSMAMRVGVA